MHRNILSSMTVISPIEPPDMEPSFIQTSHIIARNIRSISLLMQYHNNMRLSKRRQILKRVEESVSYAESVCDLEYLVLESAAS